MATRLSNYNTEKFKDLQTDLRESRLRKVSALILEEPPGPLLDIGCGNGGFSARFQELGFIIHGLDLTASQVETARQRGVRALQHDLSSGTLPYEDRSFTVVFAGEVIEHLIDTSVFLREVRRVLKPNGCLILTTPNLASFENRIRLLCGFYPIWVEYQLEGGQGHVRSYTPRALKRHLRATGFTVEKLVGNWVPFLPQKLTDDVRAPWLSFTGDLLPGLSMDLIVKARA